MRQAVIYSRVSTEEQKESGFSLQDQKVRLQKYCHQKSYQVIKHYEEDHSAKNFNRPVFNEFMRDIKEKKIKPDVFVCIRMDRFSRNAMDTLNMFNEFKKLGITIEFLENNIVLDTPESLIPFFFNVVMPEVDNKRRGLNTKRGMRQGLKEGRWMWKAPVGYANDKLNKIIVPDKNTAPIVQWAFETYAQGVCNANELWRQVVNKGLSVSKQKFYDMLCCPLYMGKIRIARFEDEAEQIVNGLHQPLVHEDIFNRTQELLSGKKKPYKGKTNLVELPLKGHLVCPNCGRLMTGSGSKGNGGVYHYYHCQRKYGCRSSFRATEANEDFISYLREFEVKEEVLTLYHYILEDVFNSDNTSREAEKIKLKAEIAGVEKRLDSLQVKFLDDFVSPAEYKVLKSTLTGRRNDLLGQLVTVNSMDREFSTYLSYGLSLLGNVSKYYSTATTEVKSKMVGSIFPENVTYQNKKYRTTKMNEVFALICSTDKAFRKQKPSTKAGLSSLAPPAGLEPATL
jgi:site-specific DNA recombinase